MYSTSTIIKIFPILVILEIGIFFYFLTKGYGKEKLRALISIFKLRKQIIQSKNKINKNRIISDKEVIEHFVNNFEIPTNFKESSSLFTNNIIERCSKIARRLIRT